jgi:hypothetical protein
LLLLQRRHFPSHDWPPKNKKKKGPKMAAPWIIITRRYDEIFRKRTLPELNFFQRDEASLSLFPWAIGHPIQERRTPEKKK